MAKQRSLPTGWAMLIGFAVASPVVVAACDCGTAEDDEPAGDGGSDGDAGSDSDADGGCASGLTCAGACCDDGERCWSDLCVRDAGTCAGTEVCQDDSTCVDGICVPWGTPGVGDSDEGCGMAPVVEGFSPVIQCEYSEATDGVNPSRTEVASTPMVADLGLPTGRPAIVFGTAAGWDLSNGTMRVIDGQTCEFSVACPTSAPPAYACTRTRATTGRPAVRSGTSTPTT